MSSQIPKSFLNELEMDRKYDSYLDEYRRIVSYGAIIVTKVKNQDDKVWDFTLNLLLKSFKPKINKWELVTGLKIPINKNSFAKVLEYDKSQILIIEQFGKDRVVKRTAIKKNRSTFFNKYSKIEYSTWFKAAKTQFGLAAALNKHLIKKKEKIRAANLGMAISKKFNVKPVDWIKKYAQK